MNSVNETISTQAAKGPAARSSRSPRHQPEQEKPAADWNQVTEIARRHLHHFVTLEPKVLQGNDLDAIHDFRVASRRLQQILDLLYPTPRPKRIRKLRRVIRRSRRLLSTVRNCDVLIQLVDAALARKNLGQRESWRAFKEHLVSLRSESFPVAVDKLSKLNLSAFYLSLQEYLDATPQASGDTQEPISDQSPTPNVKGPGEFPRNVARALQEIWDALAAQVASAGDAGAAPSLHAVRIAAKRLRYLVEVIRDLGAPQSEKILHQLRRLQQLLGDWHDLEVMEEMMAEMVARPAFLRSNLDLAMKMERLMLKNQKRKTVCENKYFQATSDSGAWSRLEKRVSELCSNQEIGNTE